MACGCKDNFIPFSMAIERAYADGYDFIAKTPWMPAFGSYRAAMRVLAEQGDGVNVIPAYQTASYRFDQASPLGDWSTIGTARTTEGTFDPEDLSPTVTSQFWIRFGYAIKKPTGTTVGVASVGIQMSFPTERLMLLVPPTVINAYANPVGDAYTELLATEWMPFYNLEEVKAAYEIFDSDSDFRYTVVLQSVKSDPTQEDYTEDAIVNAATGDGSGVTTATSFTNASSNKAQLCRVVLKADNNTSGALKVGRVYLAVASRYA